ncbi:S24 family peptidase [Massilia sp. X63]|uniref:S24 family peptidase n=1 Tax=Massilia sp. X63 TaxID=3237285 RepID=UPI0034DCD7A7
MQTIDEVRRQNLEVAIKRMGSAARLADASGTSPAYISQIKNRTPDSKTGRPKAMGDDMARRIEVALGVQSGWMDQQHGPTPFPQVFDENVKPAPMGTRPIPVISSIQAGALRDIENPYEPGDGYAVEYTDDMTLSRWAFCLDVEGLSMAPRFQPGDRLFVDPERSPSPGNFVVARNGSNQATFKKYRPRGMDTNGNEIFELVPLNDDFPTLRSDQEKLIVLGVVTEVKQRLV